MDKIKLVSDSTTSVSVGGVELKTKETDEGFVLEVEQGFSHLGTLLSHGFRIVEEKVEKAFQRKPLTPPAPAAPAAPEEQE